MTRLALCALLLLTGCASTTGRTTLEGDLAAEARVGAILDALHHAAATGDEETYFSLFTPEAIFLGTDATERWTLPAFRDFALPYFQRDSAWTYTPRDRSITLLPGGEHAFFDELLDQEKYGVCRGSGTLRRVDGKWRIAQYHLTIPLPNAMAGSVTQWIQDQQAGTRWVFVVRHAEKGEGRDPSLAAAGRARAERLALFLGDCDISACFASEYRRTIETVTPIATARGLSVTEISARDLSALVDALDTLPGGSVAVVAGHSNTVPLLIERLGIDEQITLGESDYGALFAIRRAPSGPELLRLQF